MAAGDISMFEAKVLICQLSPTRIGMTSSSVSRWASITTLCHLCAALRSSMSSSVILPSRVSHHALPCLSLLGMAKPSWC